MADLRTLGVLIKRGWATWLSPLELSVVLNQCRVENERCSRCWASFEVSFSPVPGAVVPLSAVRVSAAGLRFHSALSVVLKICWVCAVCCPWCWKSPGFALCAIRGAERASSAFAAIFWPLTSSLTTGRCIISQSSYILHLTNLGAGYKKHSMQEKSSLNFTGTKQNFSKLLRKRFRRRLKVLFDSFSFSK